ncbi:MAG: Hsp20/alpha crystallin family protein [Pedobacter sp.]
MTLVKFNSETKRNGNLPTINNVFDSIFNDTFFTDRMVSRVPAANISETENHYHVELAAPGLKKDDFKLKLERDLLSVSVEHTLQDSSEDRSYSKREFSYSSFIRGFTLPESANPEAITARYENGVLCIDIAKREEAKMVSRQIEIK